ncbi:MAG: DUF1540 domain-containing protein [Symbiobacteriia bacterium]
MADILCEVQSCHYWAQGDKCAAHEIFVVNNGRASPSMEIGTIGGPHHAQSSEETSCKTFKPRS